MQRIGTFIGAVELRAFPIHAIAGEARLDVEGIAFVGPPAVHAERESFAMGVPCATDLFFVVAGDVAGIMDRSAQVVLENHGVQGNAKVFLVELVNGSLRIGEDALVPGERAVLRVPTGGTKTRA